MSRNARRMAVSLGTAVGAAAIAASFSLGSAPLAGADVLGADAVSDLIGAADTHGLAAAAVTDAMALSYLIEAIDPNSFTAAGAPQDLLGEVGYFADTYFLGPTGLDAALAPYVEELVGTITAGAPTTYTPELSELVFALDPEAFTSATSLVPTDPLGELAYFTDTYFFGPFGIDNLIAPYVQELISEITASSATSIDASPAADLVAALDPGALADLAAPTATGVFDSALDGLLNSGLALF